MSQVFPTVQEIYNLQRDMSDAASIVNGGPTTQVPTRYGGTKSSLARAIAQAVQRYGTVVSKGPWQAGTAYQTNDVWQHPDSTWYLVLSDYTSAATVAEDVALDSIKPYAGNILADLGIDSDDVPAAMQAALKAVATRPAAYADTLNEAITLAGDTLAIGDTVYTLTGRYQLKEAASAGARPAANAPYLVHVGSGGRYLEAQGVGDVDVVYVNGTDEVALQAAVDSGAKTIKSLWPITLSSQVTIPSGVTLSHIAFNGTQDVRIQTGCVVRHCTFDGLRLRVNYDTDRFVVEDCTFKNGSFINCASGFKRGPSNGYIARNKAELASLVFGTTLDHSVIIHNEADATGRNFCISLFGSQNVIKHNKIHGSITGIIVIPLRTTNPTQSAFGNLIEHNKVWDISEECISLDCRGNSPTDGLSIASATIATADYEKVSFDIAFPAYFLLEQYVVFQEGPKKGQYFKITYSKADGLGPHTLENYSAEPGDVGCIVTLQLGAAHNTIQHNEVIDGIRAGIKIWGSFLHTTIHNNVARRCNIEIDSLSSIISDYNRAWHSPHHIVVTENRTIDGDIFIRSTNYGAFDSFPPVGCIFRDNKPDDGNELDIEIAELPQVSGNTQLNLRTQAFEPSPTGGRYITPLLTLTNNVATEVVTIPLPTKFTCSVAVRVTLGLPQVVALQTVDVIAYRSNETTSRFDTLVTAAPLQSSAYQAHVRNVTGITVTAALNTTTTYNDTATLTLSVAAALTGSVVDSATVCSAHVDVVYDVVEYV